MQITIEPVKPVVCSDANDEQSMSNEFDIEFSVSGLPHAVVKQSEISRVLELVPRSTYSSSRF